MFASIGAKNQTSLVLFLVGSLGLQDFSPPTFVVNVVLASFTMSFSLSLKKSSMFLWTSLSSFPRCTPTCPCPSRSFVIWPCQRPLKLQLLWTCSTIEIKITTVGVAKVGASSLFIGAIAKIDVVLFTLVVSTTRITCAKEGRGFFWRLWIISSLSR